MSIRKDIPELVKADVISQEAADKILDYYRNKEGQPSNRLFIVFGVLGAIMVGLGIILIIAHNWDELSRAIKTGFAFLPLLIGQLLCGFVLIKKQNEAAWRESGSAFLFFAVGASIALVSQVYNIPGDTGTFLLSWMLLALPLVYLMNASVTSLLYLAGITYYATTTGYGTYTPLQAYHLYWLLLLGGLPHYYRLCKEMPQSNFRTFHDWLLPVSVAIALGTVAKSTGELLLIAYFSLFGLYYSVGNMEFFKHQKPGKNGYKAVGTLGTIILLLVLSFDFLWENLRKEGYQWMEAMVSPEFVAAAVLSLLAGAVFYMQQKNKPLKDMKPMAPVFILFIVTFFVGTVSSVAVVLINLFVLALGILTIRDGARQDHLGVLNFGLLIITALVICRFFDADVSFVTRGILFVSVGVGFFLTNYRMLKKRKTNA